MLCRKFYRIPNQCYDKMCKCHVSPFHFFLITEYRHTAFLNPVTGYIYIHACSQSLSTWGATFKSRLVHSSLLLLLFHAHNLFLFPRLEVTSKKTFLHRVFPLINRFNSSFSTLLWDNFRVQATSKSVFMRDDAFPGEIQRRQQYPAWEKSACIFTDRISYMDFAWKNWINMHECFKRIFLA